ncbi:AAA domain-containing protein [Stutzerimonas degradans]|uniref:Nuclease n=1 Tax=Stutzerimonas degradans TaxID=2968968 RepID=A0A8E2QBQ6_9GAMM|nr:AAA domain-containing protein [Stutzerimonas degradans]MCQ4275628.1 AAA domain-containing protein [Stutzerimonas degradans]PNF75421.1 nuclease [Stutzerimonas degradans]QPT22825.1 AAA family ATPase [Stutzerimonas degradans]
MEVRYWEGGLLRHEVEAIESMRKAFKGEPELEQPGTVAPTGGKSLAQQLSNLSLKGKGADHPSGMWPWKGYAGFRFADSRGKEGEFDLVVVTHKNVIIVELKHWNGVITSHGGKWYQNGDERDRSPISVTQNKVFLLKKKLNAVRQKFPKGIVPNIKFCVVLSGKCTFDQLPDNEREHVMHLDDFLKLANERQFNNKFRPHPEAAGLNQYFDVFDELLNQGSVKPKELMVDGFRAQGEPIFKHPGEVYVEYEAANENNKADRALLRLWDFNKLDDVDAKTPEGRFKILSRERDVLVYLGQRDHELAKRCLRPIRNPSVQSVTQEFSELCELPASHYRLNEFINRYAQNFDESDRVKLAKNLVAQFAAMHGFKVAHRDLGDHSVWFSPSSAIALSNFIAAYHQPAGTVGPRRDQLSIGSIALPEDRTDEGHGGTPFHRDVFALGLLCWHLAQAKSLPLKLNADYIDSIRDDILGSDTWYAGVLAKAVEHNPCSRYANAGELLDELNQLTPEDTAQFAFDQSQLERFSASSVRIYKIYPEDEEVIDTPEKEVYRSGDCIVKLWPTIHADAPQGGQGPLLLSFFEKIELLKKSGYEFLPGIEQFGYERSGTPFLVQQFVDGQHWNELSPLSSRRAEELIRKLIAAVECLHEQQLSHGDLHPGNIKVVVPVDCEQSAQIYLLDLPDLAISGDEPFNNRYSPLAESCTPFERDNFAVMRMAVELLGMDWDQSGEHDLAELRKAIDEELQSDSGFVALERFNDALNREFCPKQVRQIISVDVRGNDPLNYAIYPDNGRLFVSVKPDAKDTKQAVVTFSGVGGSFSAAYERASKSFVRGFKPSQQEAVPHWIERNADFEIDVEINVAVTKISSLKELSAFMGSNLAFDELVASILDAARASSENQGDEGAQNSTDLAADSDTPEEHVPEIKVRSIQTSKVWKAIMDTEVEGLPTLEVSGEPVFNKDKTGLMIPYTANGEILESFEVDDKINLIKKDGEKQINIGEVDLRKSTKSALCLVYSGKTRAAIKTDDVLYLQSNKNRSSLTRRKRAIERILGRQSVVTGLVDYFDEGCSIVPERFSVPPTEEGFAVYQRETSSGQIVGLNDAQKDAFSKLITNGPVGFLQGPPGTGKTEFIAAFCHYLISEEGARNILLVSQSHEAVNTAAERIRAHCRRLNTDLDVVRFSNREQVVSDELQDVYSKSIVTQQQSSFSAELKRRLSLMAPSLGVSAGFIASLVELESRIHGLVKSIERLDKDLQDAGEGTLESKQLTASLSRMQEDLLEALANDYGISAAPESTARNMLEQAYASVTASHGVRPHEFKRCMDLIKLSEELLQRIATDGANYDEFLMRARTLVCGTCVGVGLPHLKLAENRFDWVIIDEAARSSPSELAIAMQVGSRILLVGDHRQLPPTYADEHLKAIARDLGLHSQSDEFRRIMRSDFERAFESAYGRGVSATLKVQYRMQPPIGDLVSEVFYGGELMTGARPVPECFSNAPNVIGSIVTWLDTGVLGKQANHSEQQGSTSLVNHAEANSIIRMLKDIESDMEFSSALVEEMTETMEPPIGIICMYSEQKKLVRKKFAEKTWSEDFKKLVKIDTVDSYQGKENRIVIVSLTRSSADLAPGFLRLPNRINVAMSRAMDRLVIVGDMSMWAGRNADLPLGRVATYIQERQDGERYRITSVVNAKGAA